MNKKTIFITLANVSVILGSLIGFWFIKVGIGMGRETQVDGDAIMGTLIIAASFILCLIFTVIAGIRKEGKFFNYLLPILFICFISGYVFYVFTTMPT